MKKISILITCLLLANALSAQKKSKFFEVNTCDLLGIPLPATTKKDTRMLPVVSAGGVLKPEVGPGYELGEAEVYALPVSSAYNKDSLLQALNAGGWIVEPAQKKDKNMDGDFVWLTRNGKRAFAFFTSDKYQKSLYVAEALKLPDNNQIAPVLAGSQNDNNPGAQTSMTAEQKTPETAQQPQTLNRPVKGYTYNSTNFDDGWVATEKEDWLEVTKENMKFLIHYPNPKTKFVSGTTEYFTREAWNALVAPHWVSITDFFVLTGNLGYPGGCYASANMTDRSGKTYFVVLFHRGNIPWMEFIFPDRTSFVRNFGIDQVDYYFTAWEPLEKMRGYNKLPVAPQDLTGTWKGDFGGMLQYVNAITGTSAGMATHSSNTIYEFSSGGTYKWSLAVASGYVGAINYQGAKSQGSFKMPNSWKLWLSDIEGKPREYNVQFEPIKGARILWIDDSPFGRVDK